MFCTSHTLFFSKGNRWSIARHYGAFILRCTELGANIREEFLTQIENWTKADEFLLDSDGEISIKSLLVDSQRWDGIDDYLRSMQPPIEHKGQWGGWAESFCVAWIWEVKVLCFFQNSDDSLSLACEAYGHPHPRYQLCLLWSGTHYDVLTPTDLGGEHSRDDGIVALCLVCSQINISSCPRMFTYNILSIYTYTFACTTSADTQ